MTLDLFKKIPFGLDISDFSIEALQLQKRFGKLYLGSYNRTELEEGIIEEGKILNAEKLQEKIKEVLRNAVPKRIDTNQLILSLPESKTFLHIFKLPLDIPKKDLPQAVESQAIKTIPLDTDKIYFDFQVISRTRESQEILYVAAFKEIVTDYLEVLRGIDLQPMFLDIESISLSRTFKNEDIRGEGVLIADIGTKNTILTILDKGSIRFSAIISIAGDHFTRAIAEKLNISFEKAEELKRNHGLDPEKGEGKVMFILQRILQGILDEIKSNINFYETKHNRKVKKILLCGGSGFLPKLSSYFKSNLDIKTVVHDPWKGINVDKLFKKKKLKELITTKLHPIFFANVIGLAKRGLEENIPTVGINLIPKEERVAPAFIGRKLSRSKIFSFIIILLASLVFAFFGWIIYNYILKAI